MGSVESDVCQAMPIEDLKSARRQQLDTQAAIKSQQDREAVRQMMLKIEAHAGTSISGQFATRLMEDGRSVEITAKDHIPIRVTFNGDVPTFHVLRHHGEKPHALLADALLYGEPIKPARHQGPLPFHFDTAASSPAKES